MITIERVAVEFSDMTLSLPRPHRHHDLIRWHAQITGKHGSGRQGFITSAGGFVDRKQAAQIAFDARQIELPKSMLCSEDLW